MQDLKVTINWLCFVSICMFKIKVFKFVDVDVEDLFSQKFTPSEYIWFILMCQIKMVRCKL